MWFSVQIEYARKQGVGAGLLQYVSWRLYHAKGDPALIGFVGKATLARHVVYSDHAFTLRIDMLYPEAAVGSISDDGLENTLLIGIAKRL